MQGIIETQRVVRNMTRIGRPVSEIAVVCEITTQAVYKQLRRLGMEPASPSALVRASTEKGASL